MIRVGGPAPSFGDLASAAGVAGIAAYLAPLGAPDGALDLQRRAYGTAGAGGRPLDLWVHPRADSDERRPGIVFVHGGGWGGGEPTFHLRHAFEAAARGWVTAVTSYRLTGEARWPACIEDVKCAVRWMRASADELGLDPGRIAVAGGSAGGHLSAMAALTKPGDLEGSGGNAAASSAVQAAVLWYPALDLDVMREIEGGVMIDALLGEDPGEALASASPLSHVSPNAPPVLTLSGDDDPVSPLPMLERFHAQLSADGVPNELVVYDGRGHGFDFHPSDWSDCFDRMMQFLGSHLGG